MAQVSFDRLLRAAQEPQNWLTYSGTVMSQRYSLLTQVTAANVKNLEQQWVFQARSLEKFEATPLVVDGVIYTVQAPERRRRARCADRPRVLDLLARAVAAGAAVLRAASIAAWRFSATPCSWRRSTII